MAFSGAFILGVGFSKFSSSKLMEAELGKAVSLEPSFLPFISSHINQESHKCDSTLKKSWRTDNLWQLYLWILPDQHKEFCLCRTILEIHIKQRRHLLLHFTALTLLEVYSYTGQQQTGDGVEMLISSFFAVSSASQTNHHLLVCGCRVCKATRKPALVLTQHFVWHSIFCQVLAVVVVVALRADVMFTVPAFASEVAGSQAATGERKKTWVLVSAALVFIWWLLFIFAFSNQRAFWQPYF